MNHFRSLSAVIAVLAFLSCGEEIVPVPSASPLEPSDTLFVDVPGGTFTNSRGETVEIQPFQLLRSEVNNRLYRFLADASGITHPPGPGFSGDDLWFYDSLTHPVVNVSPGRAKKAASAIGCRLPSRNEWEYAASIGLTGDISGQFPWGELSPPELPGVPANYLALDLWEERAQDGFAYTAPCGSFPLSSGGFQDLAGNAAEMVFCESDSAVHLMGGSWAQKEEAMKLGFTRVLMDGDICWFAGFRLAR